MKDHKPSAGDARRPRGTSEARLSTVRSAVTNDPFKAPAGIDGRLRVAGFGICA